MRRAHRNHSAAFKAIQMMLVLVMLGGCAASNLSGSDCAQLDGTYENSGTPDGRRLAAYLFKSESDRAAAGPMTLMKRPDGGLAVSSGRSHFRELQHERDFQCTSEGLQLLEEDTRTVGLPSVMSTTTVTRYSFRNTPEGDLQMSAFTRASARTMGVRLPGPHKEVTVEWKRVKP